MVMVLIVIVMVVVKVNKQAAKLCGMSLGQLVPLFLNIDLSERVTKRECAQKCWMRGPSSNILFNLKNSL